VDEIRADRPKSPPCLAAELIGMMAAAEAVRGLPVPRSSLPGPFRHRERFLLHLWVFLIGGWNLLMINLARTPDHLWCLPWVGGWAAVLVLHLAAILLISGKRSSSQGLERGSATPSEVGNPSGH
jgi:hypothetical protein